MKRIALITLLMFGIYASALTPFDSFAPEMSKPMLELREPEPSPDTLFCAVVVDIKYQILLSVDVSTREILATAQQAIEQVKRDRDEVNPIYYENIVREKKDYPQRGYNYSNGD